MQKSTELWARRLFAAAPRVSGPRVGSKAEKRRPTVVQQRPVAAPAPRRQQVPQCWRRRSRGARSSAPDGTPRKPDAEAET